MPTMKILIVEDNEADVFYIIRRLKTLRPSSLEIQSAAILQKAEALLKEQSFDLILLDRNLPDCDSMQSTLDFVKKYDQQKIILLTGDERVESVFECMKAGALDYWLKTNSLRDEDLLRMLHYVEGGLSKTNGQDG